MVVVLTITLMASSCSLMPQASYPAVRSDAENQLAATVRLIPINAKSLPSLNHVSPEPAEPSLPLEELQWSYRIGSGDVLNIVVWDHPQLTIPAGPQRTPQEAGNWVSPDGTIFYPYIGTLQVAGKTISEVRKAVARGLRNVIPNPQVDVSIASFSSQKVQVTGAVSSPGAVPVTNIPLTLMDAVESRKGALVDGDIRHVKLIRNNVNHVINLRSYMDDGVQHQNPRLQGGDVVVIPRIENNEVYVLGEVQSPQVVPLNGQQLSLTAALAASDGLNKSSANARGIFVFRASAQDEQIDVYQLNIVDPTALLLGAKFQLARGDVVYATSAPATRWNRIIANLIPSLSAVNTLLLIDDRS